MAVTLAATGLDIVKKAFSILGAVDRAIPLSPDLREQGFISLNYLVKTLQVNYHLWAETQGVISLQAGVTEYTLGPNGSDILERPIKIVNARYQSSASSGVVPTTKWNSTQYYETADKSETGPVLAWYYSPQLTDGILSIYKSPVDSNAKLNVTYIRPINITIDNGENVDFPSEWFLPLAYMLAQEMTPEVDTPDQATATINSLAEKYAAMVGVFPLGKLQPIPEAGV